MDDLLSEFLEEAEADLKEIREDFAHIGNVANDPAFGEAVLDLFHTVGATSAFLDLPRLRRLGEAGEAMLNRFAVAEKGIPDGAMGLVRETLAALSAIVTDIRRSGQEPRGDDANLIDRLGTALSNGAPSDDLPVVARVPVSVPQPPAPVEPAELTGRIDAGGEVSALIGDLVTVRNQLLHLAKDAGSVWEAPLERLDAVTRALVGGVILPEQIGTPARDDYHILPALLVPCGPKELRYALPRAAVKAVLRAPEDLDDTVEHEGKALPLMALAAAVDPNMDVSEPGPLSHVLVIEAANTAFALAGGEPQTVEEIVVQPLAPVLRGLPIVAGASILGDGGIVLVLDPAGLAEPAGAKPEPLRLLLVDDSAFFRNLLEPVLRLAGYAVTTVASAAEATAFRDGGGAIDVLVSDIDMPEVGGFGLLHNVRGDERWALVPAIGLAAEAIPAEGYTTPPGAPAFDRVVAKFDRDALIAAIAAVAPKKD
jgi:CheY-like chemotaxis protein